jgi:phage gpG-like protein
MADQLQIELVGADAMLKRIDAAIAQLEEPHALLDAIGAELETAIGLRFDLKADAAGHPWAPLAESTKASYERKYKGSIPGSLLERTRHMRNSLAHNATNEFVEVGFSTQYAIYHVTGTRKMPRRDPIFGFVNQAGDQGEMGAQDQADVLAVVESFLTDALGG